MNELLLRAYTDTATAVANELPDSDQIGVITYYAIRPVNPMVQAAKLAYGYSRYLNGDYDQQVMVAEDSAYYRRDEIFGVLGEESRRVWKRS